MVNLICLIHQQFIANKNWISYFIICSVDIFIVTILNFTLTMSSSQIYYKIDCEKMKSAWEDEDDERVEHVADEKIVNGRRFAGIRRTDATTVKQNVDEIRPEAHRKRLREQYRLSTIHAKTPKWARMDEAEEEKSDAEEAAEEDEEDSAGEKALKQLTRSAGNMLATRSKMLPAKHLDHVLLRDPTIGHQKGAVSAIKFHPSKPVLITASTGGQIALFQLCDDEKCLELKRGNFFLQSVSLPKCRLQSIFFYNGGNSILATASNRNYCYTYDLLDGSVEQIRQPTALSQWRSRKVCLSADGIYIAYLANNADVYVFVFKNMDHLHTFRGAENIVDFHFCPVDSQVIYAQAVNGAVYYWNLRSRTEQSQFFDEGCVRATCMEPCPNGQFLACGSNTGFVNVYDLSDWHLNGQRLNPKPVRTFSQLTTSISWLKFNRDSQMMAMGSDVKSMSARLGHFSSGMAFANFPTKQEHFSRNKLISCAFSPNSAFLAVGTNEGRTRLYRLKHFNVY